MQSNYNRTKLALVFPFFFGAIIGVIFLYILYSSINHTINFDEFALGNENTSSLELVNGVKVHCYDLEDSDQCIKGFNTSRKNDEVVLWLGNSQLHTINQLEDGDKTSANLLHQYAIDISKYVMTFSQPNANLQEHYVLFEYILQKIPVKILVLPIIFDDMRETGVRPSLDGAFNDKKTADRLKKSEIGRRLFINSNSSTKQNTGDHLNNEMLALKGTYQKSAEKYLNNELEGIWKIWGARKTFRANIFSKLHLFRNWVFGITPSSIRKIMPGSYLLNMQALNALLTSASESKVVVLIYIPPLRSDVQIPYDSAQYNAFKQEVESISANNNAYFADFGNLIPSEFWGTKSSTSLGNEPELDFMHFKAYGHELLAKEIFDELEKIDKRH
jgi:hypothetical protein